MFTISITKKYMLLNLLFAKKVLYVNHLDALVAKISNII